MSAGLVDVAKLAKEISMLRRTGFCFSRLVAAEELNFEAIVIESSVAAASTNRGSLSTRSHSYSMRLKTRWDLPVPSTSTGLHRVV